jgi:hypothetical protein
VAVAKVRVKRDLIVVVKDSIAYQKVKMEEKERGTEEEKV